jgi:predicted DNA-binding transcriptional regulator AlpA
MATTNWMRVKDVLTNYGLKRTFLYSLLKKKQIKSELISPRVRLISVSSIEEFINSSKD